MIHVYEQMFWVVATDKIGQVVINKPMLSSVAVTEIEAHPMLSFDCRPIGRDS